MTCATKEEQIQAEQVDRQRLYELNKRLDLLCTEFGCELFNDYEGMKVKFDTNSGEEYYIDNHGFVGDQQS